MKVLLGTAAILVFMGAYLVWETFRTPHIGFDEDAFMGKPKTSKSVSRKPASAQTIQPNFAEPPQQAEAQVYDNSVYDYPQDPEEPFDDSAARNVASEPESAFAPEETQAEPIEDPAVVHEAPPEEY